jgi:hypothetical protein
MAKPGKSKGMTTLVTVGTWAWANRDRIKAALQSEPVQEALKSPRAQRLLNSPALRQVVESPQVRAALNSPEVQRWLNDVAGAAPQAQPATVIPGEYEPYTGETRRLG